MSGEAFLVDHVQQFVDGLEVGVDRLDRNLRREQAKMQVLQQDDADLPDRFGGAVIALHQLLRRAAVRRIDQAHLARQRHVLHVEHEAIFATIREVMQPDAQLVEEPLVPARDVAPTRFERRHQAVLGELGPRLRKACRARDPHDRLQIAQAARAFLDVGLEVVRRVLVAQVALLLLQRLGLIEAARIHACREAPLETLVQRTRAGDEAVLEQAGANGDVVGHFSFAFGDGSHRMRRLQAAVPKQADEAFNGAAGAVGARGLRQQDQDIDVGIREELGATVSTDGKHGNALRCTDLGPQAANHVIDQARLARQQLRWLWLRRERGAKHRCAFAQFLLPARNRGEGSGLGRAGEDGCHGVPLRRPPWRAASARPRKASALQSRRR